MTPPGGRGRGLPPEMKLPSRDLMEVEVSDRLSEEVEEVLVIVDESEDEAGRPRG
jgi:hypothetical protein